MKPTIFPAGDRALSIEFESVIDPSVNRRIRHLVGAIEDSALPGVEEVVPTYRSLLLYYDAAHYSYGDMVELINPLLTETPSLGADELITCIDIPTVYGGVYGPDIDFVASHAGLTLEEVIDLHSGRDYLVYMLGFIPGFAYLGGMDPRLATPRLACPRTCIPAGSVGIAGQQTGTYPSDSPGGWQIIGRTPLSLYDSKRSQGCLCKAGNYVRYVPIDEDEFLYIKGLGSKYEPIRRTMKVGDLRG